MALRQGLLNTSCTNGIKQTAASATLGFLNINTSIPPKPPFFWAPNLSWPPPPRPKKTQKTCGKNSSFPRRCKILQGPLYYQPKQCTIAREIHGNPSKLSTIVLFDTSKMGILMTPVLLQFSDESHRFPTESIPTLQDLELLTVSFLRSETHLGLVKFMSKHQKI